MNADDLAKILDELGQRLGPTGEHVFALAVQYQLTTAIVTLVAGGAVLLVAAVGLVIAARVTRRRWADQVRLYAEGKGRWSSIQSRPDLDDYVMPWVVGAAIAAIPIGMAGVAVISALITLTNPEYAALRGLLGAIGR